MESVYCALQYKAVNTYNRGYFRWKLTTDAQVWHQVSSCDIRGGQRGIGTGFCL